MKILVIGCGSIGTRHAANAAELAEVAVFDTDEAQALKTATSIGTRSFSNLDTALQWGAAGVIVATPNHTHLAMARRAVESGAEVLIEKPLAASLDGVQEFQNLVKQQGRRVWVVCNMRFHPAVQTLYANISAIGRPLFARSHVGNFLPNMRPGSDYRQLYCAHRAQGGGVILDAIHEVDYLMWMFGGVRKVACTADRLSDLNIDVEDFACLCLTHSNGIISEIQMDYLRPFKRRGCEIVGDQGMLLWESEGKQPERCLVRLFSREHQQWQTLLNTDNIDTAKPYIDMMKSFITALSGEHTELLTLDRAAEELSVVVQALDKTDITKETSSL